MTFPLHITTPGILDSADFWSFLFFLSVAFDSLHIGTVHTFHLFPLMLDQQQIPSQFFLKTTRPNQSLYNVPSMYLTIWSFMKFSNVIPLKL